MVVWRLGGQKVFRSLVILLRYEVRRIPWWLWQVKHDAYKKARAELRKSKSGERTLAEKKADLQAQLDALE